LSGETRSGADGHVTTHPPASTSIDALFSGLLHSQLLSELASSFSRELPE
jgi:hypothetical protein